MPQTVPDHRPALGQRVRELRSRKGWSQEDFSHPIHSDRTYVISGIDRGVRNPTLEVLRKAAGPFAERATERFTNGVV
ncbi:hypothetical protein GCM10028800_05420 [Nesterenkonia populi]